MCYSVSPRQNPRQLAEQFSARIDYSGYEHLFRSRAQASRFLIAPALETAFLNPSCAEERAVSQWIEPYYENQKMNLQVQLSHYKDDIDALEKRLLQRDSKTTRTKLQSKYRQYLRCSDKLEGLAPGGASQRIFPRHYTSALVGTKNGIVVTPVRYGVWRNTGALAKDILSDDAPGYGLYNCRRESLTQNRFDDVRRQLEGRAQHYRAEYEALYERLLRSSEDDRSLQAQRRKVESFLASFNLPGRLLETQPLVTTSLWEPLINGPRALLVVSQFFENVYRHDYEQRPLRAEEKPSNQQLMFSPTNGRLMLIPCLLGRGAPGIALMRGVAAITDKPNPEVAATGHDRTPIALTPDAARRFLSSDPLSLDEFQCLLDQQAGLTYQPSVVA